MSERGEVQHPEITCNKCPRYFMGMGVYDSEIPACRGPKYTDPVLGENQYPVKAANSIKLGYEPNSNKAGEWWACDPNLPEAEWKQPKVPRLKIGQAILKSITGSPEWWWHN